MASTSACAVGSLCSVTQFTARAITLPSFAITVPKGPPRPVRTFSIDRAMASRMNCSRCSAVIVSATSLARLFCFLAASICRVAVRAQQQRHVIVLPRIVYLELQ